MITTGRFLQKSLKFIAADSLSFRFAAAEVQRTYSNYEMHNLLADSSLWE